MAALRESGEQKTWNSNAFSYGAGLKELGRMDSAQILKLVEQAEAKI
jgi:hypothetical protein